MNIYQIELNKKIELPEKMVACIGYFDGIHLGHQVLIHRTLEVAKIKKLKTCLITFNPDPYEVITNKVDKHINTKQQRLDLIESFGIENIIVINFDKEVLKLSPDDFVDKLLLKMNLDTLICGFDFHYGYRGKGDYNTLKEKTSEKLEVIEVPKVTFNDEKISSSRIIREINNGNVDLVSKLLNYDYFIEGIVVVGKQMGRTIGFPTCNLDVDESLVIMKNGIYIGYVEHNGNTYKAMMNIGHNPTFNYVETNSIEVHILDFDQNIYGENIKLIFRKYICDEKKYDTVSELVEALTYYAQLAFEQEER